jgi:hypothetical protein
MPIRRRVNQLHTHADLIGRFLHTSFQNVGDSKLFGDFTQIVPLTFVFFRGRARDHFKIRDL